MSFSKRICTPITFNPRESLKRDLCTNLTAGEVYEKIDSYVTPRHNPADKLEIEQDGVWVETTPDNLNEQFVNKNFFAVKADGVYLRKITVELGYSRRQRYWLRTVLDVDNKTIVDHPYGIWEVIPEAIPFALKMGWLQSSVGQIAWYP